MDIPRPKLARQKRTRQILVAGFTAVSFVAVSYALSRLEPAAPSVPRSSVWIDSVREGEMVRQVRGLGTLVPREIRWIGAQTRGRVERVVVRPGAIVEAETVLVEMSNPDLVQETDEARYELEAAEADLIQTELTLRNLELGQRAALAEAHAQHEGARLQAAAEEAAGAVVPALQYQRSLLLTEQLKVRLDIEQTRLAEFSKSVTAQMAARKARVAQVRNIYERRLRQVKSLSVHAGFAGVIQEVMVQDGQSIEPGANIARVARPDELHAALRIPETQARDVLVGQGVAVDTRNGIVEGRVARIDPAVRDGTVQIDVELTGELPQGARPDLSVDGTIEIERLASVVFTGRPAYGQPNSTISLFKLGDDGSHAMRVPVELGRISVNSVEIVQGLAPGDQVILSDTSAWDENDRIRLN